MSASLEQFLALLFLELFVSWRTGVMLDFAMFLGGVCLGEGEKYLSGTMTVTLVKRETSGVGPLFLPG